MNPTKSKLPAILRSLVLGSLAVAVFIDQVFIAKTAQPILVFLIIFLLGAIPALRGDVSSHGPGSFARIVMALMGVQLPDPDDAGTKSSTGGRTSSDGDSSAQPDSSPSRSSKQSTNGRVGP